MEKKLGTLTWKNRRVYKPSFWLSSVVTKSLIRKCSENLLSSHSQISLGGNGCNKWSEWNQRDVLNGLLYWEPLRISHRGRHQMGWKETVTEVAVSFEEGVMGRFETEKHNTEWELLSRNTTAPIRVTPAWLCVHRSHLRFKKNLSNICQNVSKW